MTGTEALRLAAMPIALAAVMIPARVAAQRPPPLDRILSHAGSYVVAYGDALASVIADEAYRQQVVTADGTSIAERTLKSEIAFVRLAGSTEWQAFRDVLAVDGRSVATGGRLNRVLEGAPQAIVPQARAIAAESARYNLGSLTRTFNVPTTPLQFVHPSHRERFKFSRKEPEPCGDETCWIVEAKERSRGTLIRDAGGRDIPIDASLSIEPESGRVASASFALRKFLPQASGKDESSARIDVAWRPDANLQLWVPATMHERYSRVPIAEEGAGEIGEIVGDAVYTNYRRFVVDVRIR